MEPESKHSITSQDLCDSLLTWFQREEERSRRNNISLAGKVNCCIFDAAISQTSGCKWQKSLTTDSKCRRNEAAAGGERQEACSGEARGLVRHLRPGIIGVFQQLGLHVLWSRSRLERRRWPASFYTSGLFPASPLCYKHSGIWFELTGHEAPGSVCHGCASKSKSVPFSNTFLILYIHRF